MYDSQKSRDLARIADLPEPHRPCTHAFVLWRGPNRGEGRVQEHGQEAWSVVAANHRRSHGVGAVRATKADGCGAAQCHRPADERSRDLGKEPVTAGNVAKRPTGRWGSRCLLYTSPSPRDGLLSR